MKNTRKISLIVIHCSATRVTQDFTFEKLEACHLARGFRSIGYHYYITKDGVIYPGRPESEIGAHARHFNAHSIGICYEGGLDADGNPADTRTKAQKQSLQNLLTSLCVDYPEAEILGHRDLPNVHKSCPCFSVQACSLTFLPHTVIRDCESSRNPNAITESFHIGIPNGQKGTDCSITG